jgi:hypothetical protein
LQEIKLYIYSGNDMMHDGSSRFCNCLLFALLDRTSVKVNTGRYDKKIEEGRRRRRWSRRNRMGRLSSPSSESRPEKTLHADGFASWEHIHNISIYKFSDSDKH